MTLHPKQQISSSINRFFNSIEEEKTTLNEFRSKQKEIRQQFCFQQKKKNQIYWDFFKIIQQNYCYSFPPQTKICHK